MDMLNSLTKGLFGISAASIAAITAHQEHFAWGIGCMVGIGTLVSIGFDIGKKYRDWKNPKP